jgi:dsRNA-specific ribonuclease
MEAILGAIYLDSNLEQAKKIISNIWQWVLKSPVELYSDPKSTVQEWVQASRKEIESAPDIKAHLYLFVKVRANWEDNPLMYEYMGLKRVE